MNFHKNEPLTTECLLVFGDQEKPCPSYYGQDEDKKKVKMVLQQEIHPEVHAKWGNLMCHCQLIPKMRLSKTAKNLNKVFLTSGGSTQDARCKFFQWIHTPLFRQKQTDKKPNPVKTWLQQAEQNIEKWKKATNRPFLVQSVCGIRQTTRAAAADQTKCKSLEKIPAKYLSLESRDSEGNQETRPMG